MAASEMGHGHGITQTAFCVHYHALPSCPLQGVHGLDYSPDFLGSEKGRTGDLATMLVQYNQMRLGVGSFQMSMLMQQLQAVVVAWWYYDAKKSEA